MEAAVQVQRGSQNPLQLLTYKPLKWVFDLSLNFFFPVFLSVPHICCLSQSLSLTFSRHTISLSLLLVLLVDNQGVVVETLHNTEEIIMNY